MSNSILTIDMITRKSLEILEMLRPLGASSLQRVINGWLTKQAVRFMVRLD